MLWPVGCFFPDFQAPNPELSLIMSLWSSSWWCMEISLIPLPKQLGLRRWLCPPPSSAHGITEDTVSTSRQELFFLQLLFMSGMFYPFVFPHVMRWILCLSHHGAVLFSDSPPAPSSWSHCLSLCWNGASLWLHSCSPLGFFLVLVSRDVWSQLIFSFYNLSIIDIQMSHMWHDIHMEERRFTKVYQNILTGSL